ncbi:MAG: IS1595 family transposase [Gammaproteobacteria bacterium]|nr:IS1595 family transposase [Gammaproteobacteria bacterium]
MTDLTAPIYTDPEAARQHLEAIRWPNGTACPHCGEAENVKPLHGASHRNGLYKCYSCKGHFSVTVGTVFEKSKVPLNKWVLAAHLFASSKKGISAHQLHRTLGVTYKTAWFMMHRLREAARDDNPDSMGGGGTVVEVDETFIGHDTSIKPRGQKKGRGYHHKQKVLALVERGGRVRSTHVPAVNAATLRPILREQIKADSHIMTDEAGQYCLTKTPLSAEFLSHEYVQHGIGEYVRGDIHTNTIEGYFSIFKRGMKGIYQHCRPHHLKRYLCEFDFRYNFRVALGYSDDERAELLLKGIDGKRLTYA